MEKIILFQEKQVRRVWHDDQWYFSVVDVIEILTDSTKPSNYWDTMKRRENQLSTICGKFKFLAADGKMRSTDCAHTEGLLRIIMSVPSPKAEPFKLWLAQVGKERIDEINDPGLALDRVGELYRAKGYPEEWITTRLKSLEIRKELTDEWKSRGVKEGHEYSILTAEIAKATFGVMPSEHATLKGLQKQNLRDHMTNLELIFVALGEASTTEIAKVRDAQGFNENHEAAIRGGTIAGNARRNLEAESGNKVVTSSNFLELPQTQKDIE